MFRKLKLRLRALFHRDDIGDEIAAHIEQLTDEFISQGMSPREARLAAKRQFGNSTVIGERSRDLFSFGLLEDLVRDVHYAGRVLRRRPLFYAGAAFVLALGIGANCAIFNLAYTVLLKPLPYERPGEVVIMWGPTISRTVETWRERSPGVFSDLAVLRMWTGSEAPFDLVLPDRAERLRAGSVTPNFFSVLGARAALGRVFTPSDDAAGHENLVVLSHALWQRSFSADPGVIGRAVTLISGRGKTRAPRVYTVAGVLPPGFRFTYPLETEVWAMNSWKTVESMPYPNAVEFNGAVARLAPGVSVEAANARMRGAAGKRDTIKVQPITDWVVAKARPSILLLGAISLLLLVIACATVANALLVRMAERKREMAMRASLGAGRGRLVRQLLTEGLVLSLAGTAGGLLIGAALVPIFRSLVPLAFHRADEMALDPWLLALPAAAASITTLLALLAPVFHGSRIEMAQALKTSSGSPSAVRWRFAFTAIQATVATWLLVGAAMLLMSFWRLHHVELGFDGNQVVTAEMRLLDKKWFDPNVRARFQQDVLERVRVLPGVTEAGIASAVPFRGVDWLIRFVASGTGPDVPVWFRRDAHNANLREVTPEYFSIMGLKLLRGRLLTAYDTKSSEPVAVVSEAMAREVFPGEEALGKQLDLDGKTTIVGIVNDVRYEGIDKHPYPAIYVPAAQDPSELICLVLRVSGNHQSVAAMLQGAIHQVDPRVPVMNVTTVDRIVSDSVADRRFYTTVVSAFAGLAVLLTAAGLIVVIARSIAERRRELAIRTALGAKSGQLVTLVARQGMTPVILGAGLGLFSAWSGARILEQFLFEVKLHDPAVYAAAGAFTLLIATLACCVPARRIGEAAPASVLQSE